MNWMMGLGGNGGGGKPPSPLIAGSGKWLATCVGVYAAIFWTPDLWAALEGQIYAAIWARYDGVAATAIYWLLYIAAYPLMFFATRMLLGLAFVSLVMGVLLKAFGKVGRR